MTTNAIRQIPIFRDLDDEELKQVQQLAITRSFRKKEIIFTEGEDKEAVFILEDGLAKAFKTDVNGHEYIVSFLNKGEMFPHTGLFNDNPYPATTEAIVDSRVLAIPVRSFEQLVFTYPSIAIKVMRVLGEKIAGLQSRLQELTGQDVQERCRSFLLHLAEHYGSEHNGRIEIRIPMTHQEIASTIGTTRETVNRLLNRMRKQSWIDTTRDGIIIHDLHALRTGFTTS